MARPSVENTRPPFTIEDVNSIEISILTYFRDQGVRPEESRRETAVRSWLHSRGLQNAEAITEVREAMTKKGWLGRDQNGWWLTHEGIAQSGK